MAVVTGSRTPEEIAALAEEISACRVCAFSEQPLPHTPNPVAVISATARVCICGQAPGTRVHASGRPFTDPSGNRLRQWMGIGEDIFYDPARLAIVPMGFCFPGQDARGGDLPPRRECRQTWHDRVFAAMPQLELIMVIGQYARAYHLDVPAGESLTDTVANWRAHLEEKREGPARLPLPHPSWRNNGWLRTNPWFETELLPVLRARISALI
ncbi:MAG: uracil-DNA glycosylase family protein [Rhodobiaceae bacterium]|nr:uracil-DNA glycosylase family protein [Rhodobiaceae bacterium]MCC0049714.1 uracil-DNA glycosylase family protein [Rhodobiaceae bacterium]